MDLCTVVLEHDVRVDARKYGPIVAPMLGVTLLEAKILVRKGRGIFLEDLREEDARRLAEELSRDGVPARCLRNEELPILPAPRKIGFLERSDGGLRYRDPDSAELRLLSWAKIDVVSMGAVALPGFNDGFSNAGIKHMPALHKMQDEPDARELLRENLILKLHPPRSAGPPKKKTPGSDTFFEDLQRRYEGRMTVYADVVDADRSLWLRVPMDEMSYAVDEAAVRLGEACGFHVLARDLRDRCGPALTEVSLKFEPGADLEDLVFLQIEELNRYTSWHATLHHLGMKP